MNFISRFGDGDKFIGGLGLLGKIEWWTGGGFVVDGF